MDEFSSDSSKDREQPERPRKEQPPAEVTNKETKERLDSMQKRIDKVVEGEVIRRKRPLGRRFKDFFFGSVDAQSVWEYIVQDIFVPAAKDLIYDAGSGGLERALFHDESRHRRRHRPSRSSSRTDYNRLTRRYDDRPPFPPADRRRDEFRDRDRDRRPSHGSPRKVELDDILLATRAEAEHVLDRLYDLINEYESASVSDLYELLGITSQYTDDRWGWMDLRGSGVRRTRDGYLLDLPRPIPLD